MAVLNQCQQIKEVKKCTTTLEKNRPDSPKIIFSADPAKTNNKQNFAI
jgi:hypothetical protein